MLSIFIKTPIVSALCEWALQQTSVGLGIIQLDSVTTNCKNEFPGCGIYEMGMWFKWPDLYLE